MSPVAQLLLIIIAANGAPILAHIVYSGRLRRPIDGGQVLRDGRPVFGPSKTWIGLLAALLLAGVAGVALGLKPLLGLALGMAAMSGDLISSFIKRRLGISPSSQALGLDQIPESLLPALLAAGPLQLSLGEIALVVTLFVLLELALSRLLFRLGIREQPY